MNDHTESSKKKTISRSDFIKKSSLGLAGAMLVPIWARSQNYLDPTWIGTGKLSAKDALREASTVKMEGYIGSRMNMSYQHHILMQDIDHLVEPFRNRTETRMWQSEFWGKWFTSAVLAYRYYPTQALKAKLDNAVKALLETQTEDGYIGNYAESHRLQQWDIWGRKYSMLGLLAYHELTGDAESLQAARKVADHLMMELDQQDGIIITKGNYRGMAASSVLEPICLLYNHTQDKKYLAFAEEIVRQWEQQPEGPALISKATVDVASRFPKPDTSWYSWEQGLKAYEMMSCYEGLLELYRITEKEEYKKAVELVWENIAATEMNLAGSGASAEMWFHGKEKQAMPVYHYQETCVTVTWIKLSHQLLRLTGEAKYADAVEQAFYNALLGSLSPVDQKWAKYTPLIGQRLPGSGQCGMDLNCCEASGPRGLFNIPSHIVTGNQDGLSVNYYVAGEYTVNQDEYQIRIVQETSYPKNGSIKLHMGIDTPQTMVIALRIPSWSVQHTVTVNGEPIAVDKTGYVHIDRLWKDGDTIALELDMRGRIERQDQHLAIVRGPVVLARDARLEGPDLTTVVQPVEDESGFMTLRPTDRKDQDTWMEFSATFLPESYTETGAEPIQLILCDYASAGYNNQGTAYKVWMPELQDPRK